ncbi:MAG: ABC-F family ATP-binding cassette domain-containing protein [Bacteroidales bacterium]|nr:ABC-F family ATP-binding cassette domain-containing protein [Bacteroidales bacterium]MCM1416946.1 ABC-F family ATP-binding cassette domain-containing protein [bacterium]MCM1424139.1 ABC-F family ATP-binding cassette domain-containing protein [bacterium]
MILSVNNIHKSFQEVPVLQQVSFHIEEHDKAAIVGINGAGKTTLLRIIMGELSADEGLVTFAKEKTVGYLSQQEAVSGENTIYQELLLVKQEILLMEQQMHALELQMKSAQGGHLEKLMEDYAALTHRYEQANGYAYKSELTGVLKGLGFAEEEFGKVISTLSGGQKTRVALGKLLLQKPDLIILDEPTNHLDLASLTWLETWLLNYRGAVIIVSHDRFFLDRIANKVIEIDNTKASVFSGNYTAYAAAKEIQRTAALNAYLKQQQEIRHQEAVIEKLKSFNREKSIKRAESREKMLDKIEVIDKPSEVRTDMHLRLVPRRESGMDVLQAEGLSKSFGSLLLFTNLSFSLKRGEHVAIIGDNGTGKTTILKLINELLPADAGSIRLGANVQIGYYDQEHHVLHPEKTLFEEISDEYPTLNNTEIRNTLAAFLFTGEEVFQPIKTLSGGERGRVSLAKLMLSEANFLILDEPTNHLDIQSKEILEDALNAYTGTVLYVSHDRYFINRTAHRILDLNRKQLTNYLGNYDYYLEKKDEQLAKIDASLTGSAGAAVLQAGSREPASDAKQDWKAKKEEQAARRKRENDLKKCEERIEALENRNAKIDELMASPEICTDVAKLQELNREKEENAAELAALYEKWEELSL